MRFSTPVCLLTLAALVVADQASDVISLTAETFESTVNSEELILVEFFAPWCGHCKALAPHYEEAATALKDKSITLAKVDCVDEADLCQSHGIQGYPTMKIYRKGEATEYSGPRKADGIISYMIKQSLPAVSDVTASSIEEFKKADRIVVLAYLSSSTDTPAPEFRATAEAHRDDYLFGTTTDKDAIEADGITPPAIVVYRSYDEPKSDYPYPMSSVTRKELEDWIGELAIPIIDEVNGENYAMYAGSSKPLAYLFLDTTQEDKDARIAALKPIASKYKSHMNFVWIDALKFGDHAKALNLMEPKWPAFVIQDLEKQLKYPIDQNKDFTAEEAGNWVDQYLSGNLQPQLKSQPIPDTQDESVYTLVGKNFDDVVFDDNKDVFVEFYASWCGHCKRLKPIWDDLGDKYSAMKDRIVIAKIEAQENDLPASVPFRVSSFPTIKFKVAGSRDFIDYEGDRSLESLISFVEEHAKNSLALPVPETDEAQVTLEVNTTEKEVIHEEL